MYDWAMKQKLLAAGRVVIGVVLMSIIYGILHDLVTAHVYVQYFTVHHPHIVDSQSPIVMALIWGAIATWGMGLAAGLPIGLCAHLGSWPTLNTRAVFQRVAVMLALMFIGAMTTLGISLFTAGNTQHAHYDAVLAAHLMSYFLAMPCMIWVCARILITRYQAAKLHSEIGNEPEK